MQNRMLRRNQVEAQIGLSRSSIYQMMSEGESAPNKTRKTSGQLLRS